MEKKKELWRKWNAINEKCQEMCHKYSTWCVNQSEYEKWGKKLAISGKMLVRIEFMYGIKVYYSAFGRFSRV
jgi:hypothetical protein